MLLRSRASLFMTLNYNDFPSDQDMRAFLQDVDTCPKCCPFECIHLLSNPSTNLQTNCTDNNCKGNIMKNGNKILDT